MGNYFIKLSLLFIFIIGHITTIAQDTTKDGQPKGERTIAIRSFTGHNDIVYSVAFSNDGRYILSGSSDNTLKIWDTSGQCIRTFTGHNDVVSSVAFSPDGKYAISGSFDSTIKLWDISTGGCIRTYEGHSDIIISVAISQDGKHILTGSRDHTIKLWDINRSNCLRTFTGQNSMVSSVAFCPDGKHILSCGGMVCCGDSSLKLWEISTGKCIRSFADFESFSIAISPDGKVAITCGINVLNLWNIASGQSIETNKEISHLSTNATLFLRASGKETGTDKGGNSGHTVAFSPDGKYVLSSWGTMLILWDIGSGKKTYFPTGHHAPIRQVAFSPDGKYVITGSEDHTIKMFEVEKDTSKAGLITFKHSVSHKLATNNNILKKPSVSETTIIDVDTNIPIDSNASNENTFVLIIGNEKYKFESQVKFSENDASIFQKYCEKTLGIPTRNIKDIDNATVGVFLDGLTWLANWTKIKNGTAKIIFYYAGHGMPDEKSKQSFLLPVDGNSENPSTIIGLDIILSKLTEYPSKQVLVIMDACFSGGTRDDNILLAGNTRGVKIKPKETGLPTNLILMSASSGEETAFPYEDKRHGLFTYFLLKELQDTKGNCTLSELYNYVNQKVSENAMYFHNGKMQTPNLRVGTNLENIWKDIRFK